MKVVNVGHFCTFLGIPVDLIGDKSSGSQQMSSVAYIMQWADHKTNVHNHLRLLFEEQKFVDLTLFCSTHSVKVHSVVIASNSSYFEKVLLSQNGVNSVIVLKDMKFEVLRALIEFMYCGETTVLDEDVDALLYASKKFEVKGLCKMTRQGVMFSAAEKVHNDAEKLNHRFIFPAESAQPGMIQAVLKLTQNQTEASVLENNNLDSLYLKKTVFQSRERAQKKQGNFKFPEAAMSDTEYAILKEAEESRKALEKLQKYMLNPNGVEEGAAGCKPPPASNTLKDSPFLFKNGDKTKPKEHPYSNSMNLMEDKIAAENLSNELNQQNHVNEPSEPTVLPPDVPIFVDDGNGNYVTLDVEMANMIAGQEIKYNLVQGLVMTTDGKGSQFSNPANILIPEKPLLNCEGGFEAKSHLEIENFIIKNKNFGEGADETSSPTENGNVAKRKPFVVKEMIKLKHPKKDLESHKIQEKKHGGLYTNVEAFGKLDNLDIRSISTEKTLLTYKGHAMNV